MDTPEQSPVTPAPQTPSSTPPHADNNTVMGVLCYLSILIIIPYLMAKEVPFVKYHMRQGLVLVIIEIALWLLSSFLWDLWVIIHIVELATIVLSIIGIVNVVQKKEAELPLVGSFAKNITI